LNLPDNIDEAFKRIEEIKGESVKRATTPCLLFLNGVDHVEPQPELGRIIKGVNERLTDTTILHSNLEKYVEKIKEHSPSLSVVSGELRDGYKYAYLLTGVLSTRMYLKQKNESAETELEKWAEPLSSFNYIVGGQYNKGALDRAWKYLISNHPHDSICGCSIDRVHQDMITRFNCASDIAEDISERSMSSIAGSIDLSGRVSLSHLAVFNTLGWRRRELVQASVDLPCEGTEAVPSGKAPNGGSGFAIYDVDDRRVEYQVVSAEETRTFILRKHVQPKPLFVRRFRINFIVDVPAFGYAAYRVISGDGEREIVKPSVSVTKKNGSHIVENEYLKVRVGSDGTLDVTDKQTGNVYKGLHYFEDSGDAGDEYNYAYPRKDRIINTRGTKANVRIVEKSPFSALFKVTYRMAVPESLSADRKSRGQRFVTIPIESLVRVTAGSKRVDITTTVDNRAKDHRLRVIFPSGIKATHSHADNKFDVISRRIRIEKKTRDYLEEPAATYPQDNFVDVTDGIKGLAIISKGLPEFEVKDQPLHPVALTLLRCVGYLSRGDLLTRRNNAGPVLETPDAQCLGLHSFSYSIFPHAGDWEDGKVHVEALNHNTGLKCHQTLGENGDERLSRSLPVCRSFLSMEPEYAVVSAVKKAERDDSLILRLYNISSKPIKSALTLAYPPKAVALTNLNEEPITQLPLDGNRISVEIQPRKIVTLSISLK
jgi:alpha-mannosidase